MGYDVTIIRYSKDGSEKEVPIRQDEWQAYIDADPDLTRPEIGTPGYQENIVLLPRGPDDPVGWPWLCWSGGSIFAKTPQPPTLKKMLQVADHFGAQVSGDDGEIYSLDENGNITVSS